MPRQRRAPRLRQRTGTKSPVLYFILRCRRPLLSATGGGSRLRTRQHASLVHSPLLPRLPSHPPTVSTAGADAFWHTKTSRSLLSLPLPPLRSPAVFDSLLVRSATCAMCGMREIADNRAVGQTGCL